MEYLRRLFVCACIFLLALSIPAHSQDKGYPPGTLVPAVDLELQTVEVDVPAQFADLVPQGLTLNLPPGFSVSIFAVGGGLRTPRLMEFDDNGVLHVGNMGRGQILALPDRDRDGIADEQIVALSGLNEAHSLAFYKGDLYAADEHQVIRARDHDGDLVYEETEVFISDIPWEGWHDTRTIVFDEINEKLYLSVGSPCDLCRMEEGHQQVGNSDELVPYSPERGAVLQFNADGTGRRIFATGVRNVVGMDIHPVTNELWGNNNGHDLEGRTKPAEWIDIMRDGDFMGYPFVQSHQVWNDFSISAYGKVLPITREDSLLVARQKRPVALVPAHFAPMGIHFYTGDQFPGIYKNAAFVAFRAGKAKLSSHPGYNVTALFSEPDGSNARMGDFITGFQTGTTQESVWGFPVGLATDSEGSLYVGSNQRNHVILKVMHSPISGSWEHNLPDAVTSGGLLDIEATVRVERLDASGGAPRLTADLSALGGPEALSLTAVDDSTYQFGIRLEVDVPFGRHPVRVRMEQEIDGRLRGFDFVKTIAVLPPDLPILDESLASGWRMSGTQGADVQGLTADGPVFNGRMATAVRTEPENFYTLWSVSLEPPAAVERFGFAGLRFVFHPGDVELPRQPSLTLRISGLGADLVRPDREFHVDLERREWQVVEVPFTAFDFSAAYSDGLRASVETVESIHIEGNLTGTFYLDDVRLVTGIPAAPPAGLPTAVRREEDPMLPQSLTLDPNYPNPFNSGTTIRFGLSQASTVVLDVYNLAGQEVARLVYGRREAGAYTVQWDGRDNADRELASGVYVYRLRVGDEVESRKLLLVR